MLIIKGEEGIGIQGVQGPPGPAGEKVHISDAHKPHYLFNLICSAVNKS